MEKERFFTTKKIALEGILIAIILILQVIGNYIVPSLASINLSLLPIAVGAVILGPIYGGFLGLVCGVMVLVAPSTIQSFMAINPWATVLTCLLKTTVAGVVAGLIMLPFKKGKHTFIGSIISSISVPFINTGIFTVFYILFFRGDALPDQAMLVLMSAIWLNFVIEVILSSALAPAIFQALRYTSYFKKPDANVNA